MTSALAGVLTRGRSVLLALPLAGLLLAVGWAPWASAPVATVLGAETVSVSGGEALPGVLGAALVVGAAALALGIGRRAGAVLGGVALLGAAVVATGSIAGFLRDPERPLRAAAGEVSSVPELAGPAQVTAWPSLALALAVLTALTGVLVVLAAPHWTTTAGRRFERQPSGAARRGPVSEASRASDDRTRAMDDWDALARGEDPTATGETAGDHDEVGTTGEGR